VWLEKTTENLQLKFSLIDAIQLHTVEYGKLFGLLVDASNYAVSCCCIQWSDKSIEKPTDFARCKFKIVSNSD